MNAQRLLNRLCELTGNSDDYFVTGSLSFLPRLGWYRLPVDDVDVAVSRPLFEAIRLKVRSAGLTLCVPRAILERVTRLEWEGFRYRAAPIELAFIPKAVGYLRRRAGRRSRCEDDRKELDDLVRLAPLVDWCFLGELLEQGRIRWLGRRLPGWLFDPFDTAAVLALRWELQPPRGAVPSL